jgi:hypothetical protein
MATPIASGAICAPFADHRFNGRENTSMWLVFPAKFQALTAKMWNASGRALIIARMRIPTYPYRALLLLTKAQPCFQVL